MMDTYLVLVPPMGDSRRGCISSRYIYILSTKFYGEKKKKVERTAWGQVQNVESHSHFQVGQQMHWAFCH